MDEIVSSPAKENAIGEQVHARFDLQATRDTLQFLTEEQSRRRDPRFENACVVNIHFSIK
ncbi:MAG: hypothetical protein WBW94_17510 [Anaerolineales bacterium]